MRHIEICKKVSKELSKFDGKSKSWQKAVINQLEDESNSIEEIEEIFEPLSDDLKGYYKAKNRSLGVRIVFRIISEDQIEIFKIDNEIDEKYDEVIQIIAAGRRDKVYKIASKRAINIKLEKEELERQARRENKKKGK
ncbi:hypothetical protein FQS90_02940 [Enterococcus casseliflavus]|uniref:hypothetical protein n=1 Tax=Enterococcus sp. 8E11_MSG4843 TaxID=1834190 RepID=UPI000B3E682E|nr:hypothetical protein [Enterococcus sp. 8E11_MSG4843]MBO1095511.1 hypothetical protein [Enterococcus casseliflavus]MBO1144188.1 hypothetical protein [Enterococcus casseliflavus]OUZ34518.1 hypothetical protein A5885_002249 [Enterococcus sp. 8E11_MSG4843]